MIKHLSDYCIDEDRQPELTVNALKNGAKQLYSEMCLDQLA